MAETRSVTTLQAARDASAYQRAWFAETRERVAAGSPFAVVNADAPHELFRAFDIPYVVNQWWASVVAAKQKSAPYLAALRERGYPDWSDQYGSLALASSLADDDDPPWAGLPSPTFLVAHLTDHNDIRILAKHVLERVMERKRIKAHLALLDHRLVVLKNELDRIFQCDDVLFEVCVDVLDHRRERGGFAAAS